MAFWQVSKELATDPAVVETTAQEVRALSFDAADLVGDGETVRSVETQLTDLETGRIVATGRATLAGTMATYAVKGLEAAHDYQLIWRVHITPANIPTRITVIRCLA